MRTVLLVDDHPVVRTGVAGLVAQTVDLRVVGSVESLAEAVDFLAKTPVDVVVLDLNLPDAKHSEAVARVKDASPDVFIVVQSAHTEKHYATSALRAGARAYVTKSSAASSLLHAIRQVLAGVTYVSADLDAGPHGRIDDDGTKPHERLSTREFEILCKLAAGQSVSGIAAELGITSKTVSTHRVKVLNKMELKSNAELMYYAMKHGFVS